MPQSIAHGAALLGALILKDEYKRAKEDPEFSAWMGHVVTDVRNGAKYVSDTCLNVVHHIFRTAGAVAADSNALANALRRINKQILVLVESLRNTPGYFDVLRKDLSSIIGVVDLIQIASDINYFVKGKFKESSLAVFCGKVTFAFVNTGVVMLWTEQFKLVSWSKVAQSIGELRLFSYLPAITSSLPYLRESAKLQSFAAAVGEVRLFSFVAKIPLLSTVQRLVTLGYSFLAINAIQRLFNAKNEFARTSAGLDCGNYLSEVALDALIVAGVTNIITLGAVGGACLTFGLSSFIYKHYHQNELKV